MISLSAEDADRLLGRVAVEPEVRRYDVLGEIGTRLDRVLEHPFDGALFGRLREEVRTGEGLLFLPRFTVILFDPFELCCDDTVVSHAVPPRRSDRSTLAVAAGRPRPVR
jgi:hypothetical protein